MKKDRDAYIVIAPTGKSKIYSVAARRIGSKERYSVIATCQNEVNADNIVDGLKLLQGEEVKVTTTAERALADVRSMFANEAARSNELRQKLNGVEREMRIKNDDIRELQRKLVLAVPQPSLT